MFPNLDESPIHNSFLKPGLIVFDTVYTPENTLLIKEARDRTCHILTGEAVLLLAPFTKLSHIVLFFMSRGQLGMDYNIKRGGHARETAFPW